MKCGICKSDQINVYASDRSVLRTRLMRDSGDVWAHKRDQHREEMYASRDAATERRRAKEQAERDDDHEVRHRTWIETIVR